jgi:hypothetical protein
MAEVLWYYAKNDQQVGPVSPTELKQLVAACVLLPEDLIWRDGMETWAPAARVKGLFPEPRGVGAGQNAGKTAESATTTSAASAISTVDATPIPSSPLSSSDFLSNVSPALEANTRGHAAEDYSVEHTTSTATFDLLWLSQVVLWGICIGTVVVGGLLFARAYFRTTDSYAESGAAAAIYAAFSLGAYILARSGERVATLLQAYFERQRP